MRTKAQARYSKIRGESTVYFNVGIHGVSMRMSSFTVNDYGKVHCSTLLKCLAEFY